jgi:hypothetical protein
MKPRRGDRQPPLPFRRALVGLLAACAALLSGCESGDGNLSGTQPPDNAPRFDEAFFIDVDGNGSDEGDVLVFAFQRPVVVRGSSLDGFVTAAQSDSFGDDPVLSQSLPGSDRVEVSLGTDASLVPGTPATAGVTRLNIETGHDVTQVLGSNGVVAAGGDSDIVLQDITDAPPVLLGARFVDADGDGAAGAGDLIVASFSKPVDVPAGASVPANFVLPVAGDSFGTAPAVAGASADATNRTVLITLGAGASLTLDGEFSPAATAAGSPSGLAAAASPTITDTVLAGPNPLEPGATADLADEEPVLPGNGRDATAAIGQTSFTQSGGGRFDQPTGVLLAGGRLIVADTAHSRVLIYDEAPGPDDPDPDPDTVLGQASLAGILPNRGGPATASTLNLPSYVATDGTALVVADAGNHRVLIWSSIPAANGAPADVILGQATADGMLPNAGGPPAANTLRDPQGLAIQDDRLIVADGGNHRVLIFDGFGALAGFDAAGVVLGQGDFNAVSPDRGGDISARGLDGPTAVLAGAGRLFVADTGNHRVLVWKGVPASSGREADGVLGQIDFESAVPGLPGDSSLIAPAGLGLDPGGEILAVSDTGHDRVLLFEEFDGEKSSQRAAEGVLGQSSLVAVDEDPSPVSAGTLEGPRGVFWNGYEIYVADTGNGRVNVFR